MQAIPALFLTIVRQSQILNVKKLATIVVHVHCFHVLPCVLPFSPQKHCFEVVIILFDCIAKPFKFFKSNFLFVCNSFLYICNSVLLNK